LVLSGGDPAELRLRSLPGTGRPLAGPEGDFGGLALPTGLAVDGEGRVYILDAGAPQLKRFDPRTQAFTRLPCIAGAGSRPRQVDSPHGLAISPRGDLLIADTGNRRVQVFSLKGLHLRSIWGPLRAIVQGKSVCVEPVAARQSIPRGRYQHSRPEEPEPGCGPCRSFPAGTWEPWDIVVDRCGWAYVSDPPNGLIHCFDPRGRWQHAFCEEESGRPLQHPEALALGRVGEEELLYVVQAGRPYIAVLDLKGRLRGQVTAPDELEGRFEPLALAIDAHGNLCLSERFTRSISLYCEAEGPAAQRGCPAYAGAIPGVEGPAAALVFDRAGDMLAADAQGRRVVCLPLQARRAQEGSFTTQALDSGLYRCRWHRIVLDVAIPQHALVLVHTFTAEVEMSKAEILQLGEGRWAAGPACDRPLQGEWDCLVQSPPGRYLWLRLTLLGNGSQTPIVRKVKVHFPRITSLEYLPAVFQENADGGQFLEQFLAIFDTLRDAIGSRIGELAGVFDPDTAQSEPGCDFLAWLASWLGLTLERNWPPAAQRRLLALAHRLFALRGTAAGLRLHLSIYTGLPICAIQVLEHYRLRNWLFLGDSRLGDGPAVWGKAMISRLQIGENSQVGDFQLIDAQDPARDPLHFFAFGFTVYLPGEALADPLSRRGVERIVEMSKPAYTQGTLQAVELRFQIGGDTFVGVNTVVGGPLAPMPPLPAPPAEGESQPETGRLGQDTVIGPAPGADRPPSLRIGAGARLGLATCLD
jgi:phage tail-like protein